jgi:hypothetical protein
MMTTPSPGSVVARRISTTPIMTSAVVRTRRVDAQPNRRAANPANAVRMPGSGGV